MARKKLNLAYIPNDAVRRATLKKRRKGLIKKVSELSTLCDVPACIVIYGPHEAQPEVWPPEPQAREILQRFRALPEVGRSKRMMNQEGFLRQQFGKKVDQFRKNERDVRNLEMAVLVSDCVAGRGLHDVGLEDCTGLLYCIDMRLKALHEAIEITCKAKTAVEAEVAGEEVTVVAAAPAMEEMAARQDWFPETPMPGCNGGLGDILQPYLDNGSPWIMDPDLFSF